MSVADPNREVTWVSGTTESRMQAKEGLEDMKSGKGLSNLTA